MRHSTSRALTSGLICAGLLAVPSSAVADTENCASRGEYEQLAAGMSPASVRALFDINGFYDGDGSDNTYKIGFRTCWAPGERKIVTWFAYGNGLLRRWDVRDA